MPRGTLYIISAPSGAGKTSLVRALLAREPNLVVSVSHTTRGRRETEVEGVAYHFVTRETFLAMLETGAFLEHALVFGNYYGTAKDWVDTRLDTGTDVILEIDWQGAGQVRSRCPCVAIFVLPPSLEILEQRLRGRAQDNAEVIARRTADAVAEISHCREFDYVVVNNQFEKALDDLRAIVSGDQHGSAVALEQHQHLIDSLLASGPDSERAS